MDVVVDVGGVYEADNLRFDHHQRGFEETFSKKHDIKLSSAGLVYKHFGKEIIGEVVGEGKQEAVDLLFDKIYDGFIQELDGVDNGVNAYPTDIKPR